MAAAKTGGFFFTKLAYVDADGLPVIYREGSFNSTETKPLAAALPDTASGSIIVEPDTGKVFFYNRPGDAWVEQFAFQA